MFSRAIVLRGSMTPTRWRRFLEHCAKAMGMTSAGKPAVWKYPTEGGKGGVGYTICLPITESFLVLDTWSDFDGAYLFIASCKRFALSRVSEMAMEFGLDVEDVGSPVTLGLR